MNASNSQAATKPSTIWVKRREHLHWHYIVRETDSASFCGLNVSVTTSHQTTKMPPKKQERCGACHAEAERILRVWTEYKRQLRSNQCACTPSALGAKQPATRTDALLAHKPTEYLLETAMVIAAIKDLAKLGHQCNAALEQKQQAKRKRVSGTIRTADRTVQHWKDICTDAFKKHPAFARFWQPILQKFSHPNQPCTHADLINHVNAVAEAYEKYREEVVREQKEHQTTKQPVKVAKPNLEHQKVVKPKKRSQKMVVFRAGTPAVCQSSSVDDYWTRYERQGTRGSSLDPANNSDSGVRGNPTYDRW